MSTSTPPRKCGVGRLVVKAPEPSPETLDETFLDLARRKLGLPSHTPREDVLRALAAHCSFVT